MSASRRTTVWTGVVAVVLLLVIVPFLVVGANVETLSSTALEAARGSPLVSSFVVMVLMSADVFLPVPASLVGVASGAALGTTVGTIASGFGMSLGCVLGYAVARGVRRGLWRRDRYRPSDPVSESTSVPLGAAALFASRAVPVLAESSVLLFGLLGGSFRVLLLATTPANFVVSYVYARVGAAALHEGSLMLALVGATVLPVAAWLGYAHRSGRRSGLRADPARRSVDTEVTRLSGYDKGP